MESSPLAMLSARFPPYYQQETIRTHNPIRKHTTLLLSFVHLACVVYKHCKSGSSLVLMGHIPSLLSFTPWPRWWRCVFLGQGRPFFLFFSFAWPWIVVDGFWEMSSRIFEEIYMYDRKGSVIDQEAERWPYIAWSHFYLAGFARGEHEKLGNVSRWFVFGFWMWCVCVCVGGGDGDSKKRSSGWFKGADSLILLVDYWERFGTSWEQMDQRTVKI